MHKTDLLLKIQALMQGSGFTHEREAARATLERLMAKYGFNEQDLAGLAIETRWFKYKDKRQEQLLGQIAGYVMDNPQLPAYRRIKNNKPVPHLVGIDCTLAQKLEIEFLFEFYTAQYLKEEQKLYLAFLHKHKLFAKSGAVSSASINIDKILQQQQMMRGMDDVTPHRLIDHNMEVLHA